jgi:1,4-alpha-glucan branching enzyme
MSSLVEIDPWLAPYAEALASRHDRFQRRLDEIRQTAGSLSAFANGHLYYGLHQDRGHDHGGTGGFICRESAPAAHAVYLIGDFNDWNRRSHPFQRLSDDTWEIKLSRHEGLAHGQRYKVHVVSASGAQDRIPPYARRVIQDPETHDFAAQVWAPNQTYIWQNTWPSGSGVKPRLIYEAHVGMAQEKEGLGTYKEFADRIIPRIARGGYEALQLMAIMEHPYYGSFGYHVANFFAPSSRFGTPDDLRYLIDCAHGHGLRVLLDVVHSHAVRNEREGLANFDGTVTQFFHDGMRGDHPLWDSKLFNYGRPNVQHFLLSNLKYWMEEFRFDGFRFDGVTSMLYQHHGVGVAFDHYDRYFDTSVDEAGVTYLTLANQLIHELGADAISIAEDVSGMPGIALAIENGGIGFDYRLAMGHPDFWVRSVESKRDEDWSMSEILRVMTDKRSEESVVGYVESHDQSLVGDKSMIFRMADAQMYDHMRDDDSNIVVERAIALHKMMRLVTLGLGSNAYLNFMGNEFGHPEWVDFPREGNGWSYKHARRQWSLADHPQLKFRFLGGFDQALMHLVRETQLLTHGEVTPLVVHDDNKILVWRRGRLIFAINLHPHRSEAALCIPNAAPLNQRLRLVLSSDDQKFGGLNRTDPNVTYETKPDLSIYLPCRTGIILGFTEVGSVPDLFSAIV